MPNDRAVSKRKQLAYTQGWVSILVNGVLFVLKYWAGFVSGSLALMADAWHTLSDSLSSVIVLVGTRISEVPPDKEHPFGHGRAELIAAIIIGVILGLIGFEFARDSLMRLVNQQGVVFGAFAIWVTIISAVVKEALAQFSFRMYRKTGNPALKADGWHHRSDAISSAVILIGILAGRYFWWIDGALGLLVSLLIFYAAYETIREGTNPLLGEPPDENLSGRLKEIARQASGMETHLHHVHMHKYGEHIEITAHILLPGEISLEKAHDITDGIERGILKQLGIEATIHMEPLSKLKGR
jgi:cation diffusion facilitator family transporter